MLYPSVALGSALLDRSWPVMLVIAWEFTAATGAAVLSAAVAVAVAVRKESCIHPGGTAGALPPASLASSPAPAVDGWVGKLCPIAGQFDVACKWGCRGAGVGAGVYWASAWAPNCGSSNAGSSDTGTCVQQWSSSLAVRACELHSYGCWQTACASACEHATHL